MSITDKRKITFEHAPPIQQMTTCLPDDPHKTIVREDGSVNYYWRDSVSFDKRKFFWQNRKQQSEFVDPANYFAVRLIPRFTHRDILIRSTQQIRAPQIPIVRQLEQYEHTKFEWTIFSIQHNQCRADIILWTLTADKDFGHAPSRTELSSFGSESDIPTIIESAGTTAYWTAEGLQLPGLTHYDFLHAEESKKGVFAIILKGSLPPDTVTVEWAEAELAKMHTYWLNLRPFKRRFTIPDTSIQEMLESSARNILQARETENGISEYKVGPTMYRNLYMIDGHFLLQAAHIMGRQEEAFEQGLTAILRRIQPNGSVEIIPQHLKETGIAMATIVRQCELMGDNERLIELWPTILRALDYLCLLREQAQSLGSSYPGIFPPAYLDGGISGPHPDYTTPSWALIGLKYARNAGKRLNLPRTEDIAAFHDEIYQAFLSCAERDIAKTAAGIPYIPMIMEHRDYNHPQSATWAFAHAIYPGEIFTPDHEYVKNLLALLDSVDDEQGIPKETGWIHDQGIWGYSSMFYAQVWLYAGRGDKAIDYLYAFANHAAPSRVWREEQSLTASHSAEYCGDMPHNWGSAEFIRLVRNAIIMERQGNIELLVGLPAEWLPEEGKELCIEDSPTRYGLVTLQLRVVDGGYELEYRRHPGVIEPSAVILHWKNKTRSLPADSGVAAVLRESLA